MQFVPGVSSAPIGIPALPVRIGLILGGGLFCVLLAQTALKFLKIKKVGWWSEAADYCRFHCAPRFTEAVTSA